MTNINSRLALLFVSVVVGTAGSAAQEDDKSDPKKPAPAQAPRLDIHGDALPPGAVARLGTVRFRAPDEAYALAFSLDGKIVAVSSRGGLFIFDAGNGKRIKRLGDYASARYLTNTLAFSPDSKRLIAWGESFVRDEKGSYRTKTGVREWVVSDDGKPKQHDVERLVWLGWTPEGHPVVVCLEKGALALRELATGKTQRFACAELRRPELSEYVTCVCAPAGRALAVIDEKYITHVWDTATGVERCTVAPHEDNTLRGLALSPDGKHLAFLTQGKEAPYRNAVQIADAVTGKVLRTVATDQKNITTLTFSLDGKTLATAGYRGISCWDVDTGKERSRSEGVGANTERIAMAGDGQTLATLQRHSGAFHLWDVATGKRQPQPAGHMGEPYGTSFSPDGKRMVSGGALDGDVHIWDLDTCKSLVRIHGPGRWVRRAEFSRDGRFVFSTWTNDELWISDAATGERRDIIKLEDPERPDTYQSAWSMQLSTDGKKLAVLSTYYPKKNDGPRHQETLITGWDPQTRKQLFLRRLPGSGSWTAISADARLLAAAHAGAEFEKGEGRGPTRLENLMTGELLLNFPSLEGQTWPLAFSPDSRLLAANNSNYQRRKKDDPTSSGSSLVLWELATGTEVLSLPLASQYRIGFSPDGRLLALTAPPQEIMVWDLAHGRELIRFKKLDAALSWLTFTPDHRRVISGHTDSTLLIWDLPAAPPAGKLSAEDMEKAWADLAGSDAPRAFRARWALANAPDAAIPLLKKHLAPTRPADPKRLQQLLTSLDSDQFAVRAAAHKELEELGDLAADALRQTLAKGASLELRRRIETLLEKLNGPITRSELLRAVRAVADLEDMNHPEARTLLTALSKGAAGARLTQEAQAALERQSLSRTPTKQ